MYSEKNNRIYCGDCNKSYIPNIYSNHLKSKGHFINVMKKQYCSCINDISRCDNHDLTYSMLKVSLESIDSIKTDFSNKLDRIRKQSNKFNNIDPDILLDIYRKHYSGCYNDKESNVEGKALLSELYRIDAITWRENIEFVSKCHD